MKRKAPSIVSMTIICLLLHGASAPKADEVADLIFSELLEAGYSGDGEFALERLGSVKFFLHKNGIDAVEWSPENDELFDRLPAAESGTIRPALVSEGKLLKKGLAAAKMP